MCDLSSDEVSKIISVPLLHNEFPKLRRKKNTGAYVSLEKSRTSEKYVLASDLD